MKLFEITEKESEKLFRQLVVDLTGLIDTPFRRVDYQGEPNDWQMESKDPKKKVWMVVHLINDEGENYVDFQLSTSGKDEETRQAVRRMLMKKYHFDNDGFHTSDTAERFWWPERLMASSRFRIYEAK